MTVGVSRWGDPVVYEDNQVLQVGTIHGAEKIAARTSHRRAWQIEKMIAEFERRADDLEREILVEQNRTGIHDTAHYAYPTYAKAAALRRDNLHRSAEELRAELQRSGLVSSEPGDNRISNARHVMSSRRESLAVPASPWRL